MLPTRVMLEKTPIVSLQIGKTPPTRFDTGGEVPVTLELWGDAEYTFIAIAPKSTLAQSKVKVKLVTVEGWQESSLSNSYYTNV